MNQNPMNSKCSDSDSHSETSEEFVMNNQEGCFYYCYCCCWCNNAQYIPNTRSGCQCNAGQCSHTAHSDYTHLHNTVTPPTPTAHSPQTHSHDLPFPKDTTGMVLDSRTMLGGRSTSAASAQPLPSSESKANASAVVLVFLRSYTKRFTHSAFLI